MSKSKHPSGRTLHQSRREYSCVDCSQDPLTADLKGAVSRYSVIFCAFLREQKMAVARASVADIRPESLIVRAAWQPGHLRWLLTWQCREPSTSRARVALLHLSTATGSTFVFRLRGPSKVISPSSRFKISSDSYIDIDSLFSCLVTVLRAFRSLLRRSRRREHGWLGEGIGSVVVAPFPVTLTMCVTVKANALNEERVRGTDVDVRVDTGRCCGICTVRSDKDLKTQETHLW